MTLKPDPSFDDDYLHVWYISAKNSSKVITKNTHCQWLRLLPVVSSTQKLWYSHVLQQNRSAIHSIGPFGCDSWAHFLDESAWCHSETAQCLAVLSPDYRTKLCISFFQKYPSNMCMVSSSQAVKISCINPSIWIYHNLPRWMLSCKNSVALALTVELLHATVIIQSTFQKKSNKLKVWMYRVHEPIVIAEEKGSEVKWN